MAIQSILDRLLDLHPKVIDLSLDRMKRLLFDLGHPERAVPPVFHVAGTNGKGSTCATLRALIEAMGKSAHVYTSPHLVRFAERIRLNGQIINDDALAALLEECESLNRARPITFFEITTAVAFLAFARHLADALVLEVGLGGRLDATNVIDDPLVSVITPISLDHQAFLGESLAEIAGEKAGIIKQGRPCVVAAQSTEALRVIQARADALGAPIFLEGRDWHIVPDGSEHMMYFGCDREWRLPRPILLGEHQIHNAGLALAAMEKASDCFALSQEQAASGLRCVEWPARLQRLLPSHPLANSLPEGWRLWLDGGHNPDAGQALSRVVSGWKVDRREIHLVVGMINTKDVEGFLAPLVPHVDSIAALTIPNEANAISAARIAEAVRYVGGRQAIEVAGIDEALNYVPKNSGRVDILICGSLYLAGAILALS